MYNEKPNLNDYLEHVGVLGMRWGKHKTGKATTTKKAN